MQIEARVKIANLRGLALAAVAGCLIAVSQGAAGVSPGGYL